MKCVHLCILKKEKEVEEGGGFMRLQESLSLRKNHHPHLHLPGDMYLLVQNMMYGQTEILIFCSAWRFVSVWMLRYCRATSNKRKKTKNIRYFCFSHSFCLFFVQKKEKNSPRTNLKPLIWKFVNWQLTPVAQYGRRRRENKCSRPTNELTVRLPKFVPAFVFSTSWRRAEKLQKKKKSFKLSLLSVI